MDTTEAHDNRPDIDTGSTPRPVKVACMVLALCWVGAIVAAAWWAAPAPVREDESPYLFAARRLKAHGTVGFTPEKGVPAYFPLEYVTADGRTFWPKHGPGYSWAAAATPFRPHNAMRLINVLAAMALLALVWRMGRDHLTAWGFTALIPLFVSLPEVNLFILPRLSDLAGAALGAGCLAALLAHVRRPSFIRIIVAALLLAAAVSTRCVYAVFAIPAIVAMGSQKWRWRLAFGATLVVGLLPLFIYHGMAFGNPVPDGLFDDP